MGVVKSRALRLPHNMKLFLLWFMVFLLVLECNSYPEEGSSFFNKFERYGPNRELQRVFGFMRDLTPVQVLTKEENPRFKRRMMRPPTLTSSDNSGDSERERGHKAYVHRNSNYKNWL